MRVRAFWLAAAVAAAWAIAPGPVHGQGYRGRASTTVSFIQFRQIVLDSVPEASVPGEGVRRLLPDGTRVLCGAAQCHFYRSGPVVEVAPLLQDVEFSVWPGVSGLRGYAHVRARQPLGEELWPRSEKRLEALAAYLEYSRPGLRLRGGRLWRTSGLGFYNFDGADVLVRLPGGVRLEGYAGLSLLRGLNEGHTGELLAAVEPFPPDEGAYLFGVQANWRPLPALAGSVVYQRELHTDRAALYSERIAADARILAPWGTVDLDIEVDVATATTNEARVRVSVPVGRAWLGTAEFRRRRPYFDLWTIWGAFSPVGFSEGRIEAGWSHATGRASARAGAAYRRYEEANTSGALVPIEGDGWRLDLDGRMAPFDGWTVNGRYRRETGFGAARSSGDLSVQRAFGEGNSLGLTAAAFQNVSEFQVGEGVVLAAGVEAGLRAGPARVQAGAAIYRHDWSERPAFGDWSQLRAHAFIEIPIGRDPGLARRGTR